VTIVPPRSLLSMAGRKVRMVLKWEKVFTRKVLGNVSLVLLHISEISVQSLQFLESTRGMRGCK